MYDEGSLVEVGFLEQEVDIVHRIEVEPGADGCETDEEEGDTDQLAGIFGAMELYNEKTNWIA